MIKELTRVANSLDAKGLQKEADYLDKIINKLAAGWGEDPDEESDGGFDDLEFGDSLDLEATEDEDIINRKDPFSESDTMEGTIYENPAGGYSELKPKVELEEADNATLKGMMKEFFDMIDSDNSGEISKEEFEPAFYSMLDRMTNYLMEKGMDEEDAHAEITKLLEIRGSGEEEIKEEIEEETPLVGAEAFESTELLDISDEAREEIFRLFTQAQSEAYGRPDSDNEKNNERTWDMMHDIVRREGHEDASLDQLHETAVNVISPREEYEVRGPDAAELPADMTFAESDKGEDDRTSNLDLLW